MSWKKLKSFSQKVPSYVGLDTKKWEKTPLGQQQLGETQNNTLKSVAQLQTHWYETPPLKPGDFISMYSAPMSGKSALQYYGRQQEMERDPKKLSVGRFTRVKNLEFNKEGSVDDVLSTQITVNYDDGTFGFLRMDMRNAPDGWETIAKKRKPDTAKLGGSVSRPRKPKWMNVGYKPDLENPEVTEAALTMEIDEFDAFMNQFIEDEQAEIQEIEMEALQAMQEHQMEDPDL